MHRVSEEIGNLAVRANFRIAWVRLRAMLRKEFMMGMEKAKDEHEEYVKFWEARLDEMYEVGEDMTVVEHGGKQEVICKELLW